MKKIILYFFIGLFIIAGALASPVFSVQGGTLNVESANPEYYAYNSEDATLNFKTYNYSGGYLNNTQGNCSISFYNISNGREIPDISLSKDTFDWYYTLNWSIFDRGKYGFIVSCYSVGVSPEHTGYLRSHLIITNSGEELSWEAYMIGAILIVLPLLIAWLMLTWALALGEEHTLLKIFMSLFSMMSVIFSFTLAILNINKFFNWTEMTSMLNIGLIISAIIAFVVLTYWCIYLFQLATKALATAKAERLKY